jgi:hypothetical protein
MIKAALSDPPNHELVVRRHVDSATVKAPDHCPMHAYSTLGMDLRCVHPSELTGGVTLAEACIPGGPSSFSPGPFPPLTT